ncbi:MAG: ArsR/SmtB family transcription factor [Bacillus sp. (in: firmicutes)]
MNKSASCDVYSYDEQKVSEMKENLKEENMLRVAGLFKALADENRAKIIYALTKEKELCVCDLANIIGSTVAATSHHLRTLYKQEFLTYRKEGKMAIYSLNDECVKQLIHVAMTHVKEVKDHV